MDVLMPLFWIVVGVAAVAFLVAALASIVFRFRPPEWPE